MTTGTSNKTPRIRVFISRHFPDTIEISGDTKHYRNQIKTLGGVYQTKGKYWKIPTPLTIPVTSVKKLIKQITKAAPAIRLTTFNVPNDFFDVIGDTYQHRNELKKLGARWVGERKAWRFRSERIIDVMDYVDTIGGPTIVPIVEYNIETSFDAKFIFDLFKVGGKTLKFPKIRLLVNCGQSPGESDSGERSPGVTITLKLKTGEPGVIYVYGQKNKILGYIYPEFLVDLSGLDIIQTLKNLSKAPLDELKRFGLLTGRCPFCYKELSKEESVVYGYGPVCARKFGLEPPY